MLAGVAGDGTELVQELALLASAGPRAAWRQSPRQVMPTGLLHRLIGICSGRIRLETTATRQVGRIPLKLVLGVLLHGDRRQRDGVAEGLESAHMVTFDPRGIRPLEIVGAELGVRCLFRRMW